MPEADPLAVAARHEADLRARKYPALVASNKMTADEATLDYQAWCCIADWLESGQFKPVDRGGIDGLTVVDWLLAEQAADRCLAVITREALAAQDEAKRDRLNARGAAVKSIGRKVSLRRQMVASINAEFGKRRREALEAAA